MRYGANTTFVTGTFTGGVACDNRIFGDPLPGVEKRCELADEAPAPTPSPSPSPAPAPAPATWTFCANERTTCSFTGTRLVRYGANTTFVTGTFTGGVACDNRIFGDPLPGVEKRCELAAEAPAPAPAPSPSPSPSPAPAPGPAPAPAPASLTMSCVEGVGYQCSGTTLIRSANGVALTSSGVQVYGRSTGDVLYPSNPNIATGLALASGGLAEFRSAKDGTGVTLSTAILLKNLGISWDGVTDRPQIIELFDTTAGRVELGANGALVRSPLPDAANLTFYDFATKGHNGTQANYANNRYFPRTAPSRCDPGDPCRTTETSGLNRTAGNWRSGGTRPDVTGGQRLHEDGDIHAGNGLPDANGNPTLLPGGNGIGVPFPGSKGVRDVVQWSYRYSNIGYWGTRDTIHLGGQWAAGNFFEHNTERTGVVTFGEVSDSNAIPTTGSATYNGFVYGSYAPNGVVDRVNFNGRATVTVNFATRSVVVTINNCVQEGSGTTLPISFVSSTTMGAVSAGEANYSTGTVSGTLSGGLSSRFFGPANVAGTNGSGPPEIGGAFSLSNSSAAAVVAGFIAYKN